MHFLRQLLAYSFGRCNFSDARSAQPLHRTEFSKKQTFAVLTHPGTIVEDAFSNPFFHQELVIGVGETMRFVPDARRDVVVCRGRSSLMIVLMDRLTGLGLAGDRERGEHDGEMGLDAVAQSVKDRAGGQVCLGHPE